MSQYSRDPYWTIARFASVTKDGVKVRKGDRIFYYPLTRTVLVGEAAERAAADFRSSAFDEDQYQSQYR